MERGLQFKELEGSERFWCHQTTGSFLKILPKKFGALPTALEGSYVYEILHNQHIIASIISIFNIIYLHSNSQKEHPLKNTKLLL